MTTTTRRVMVRRVTYRFVQYTANRGPVFFLVTYFFQADQSVCLFDDDCPRHLVAIYEIRLTFRASFSSFSEALTRANDYYFLLYPYCPPYLRFCDMCCQY